MNKVLKYCFLDLSRSRWSYVYFGFYLVLGFTLLFLNNDLSKALITLMNVIVVLTPLIGTLFGIMYFYSSSEFVELLLAQPIKRTSIFLGQYIGIALSLSLSLVFGLGLPFVAYGLFSSSETYNFILLITTGVFLTFIFVAISVLIALLNSNKVKGFGYAVLIWLFFSVIYDGIILLVLTTFDEYELDTIALVATFLNPIDLSRILILMNLELSALMGYTGALFQRFFGSGWGMFWAIFTLLIWILVPTISLLRVAHRKDF